MKLRTLLYCATLLAGAASFGAAPARAATPPETLTHLEVGHPVAFDVLLPLRNRDKLEAFVADLHDPASPNFHKWVTPAGFGLRFGPDAASVAKVVASLKSRGFNVTVQTRSLHVTGTSDAVERNFGTKLMLGTRANGETHIFAATPLTLPPEIASTGAFTFSFSPHMSHVFARRVTGSLNPDNRNGTTGGYWWDDLKEAYAYPSILDTVTVGGVTKTLDGAGVNLGVLMSSDIFDKDIKLVFNHEKFTKISGLPIPVVSRVYVNGGATTKSGALDEASLDTQEETTGAPGANVTLFDIPDLSDGNISAGYITIDETNSVDLVSSSFGACELEYTPAYNGGIDYTYILKAEHELFLQGNAQGITFLASSGDEAGRICPSTSYSPTSPGTFVPSVSSPADDPNVTAVGGTNVVTTYFEGTLDSVYVGENAWSDPLIPFDIYGFGQDVSGGFWGAGGGYSKIFKKPAYQTPIATGGPANARAMPDVGMQVGGCPSGIAQLNSQGYCDGGDLKYNGNGNEQRSYVIVAIDGGLYGLIGTSVSSPEFAGATALLIEQQGRMGNLNTYLYALAAQQAAGKGTYFHTNIQGYNGVKQSYRNGVFNLSVGVGTPIVVDYIGLPDAPKALTPQTPSNP